MKSNGIFRVPDENEQKELTESARKAHLEMSKKSNWARLTTDQYEAIAKSVVVKWEQMLA